MVYKSKKINKRRYRRQSRKLMRKRMYGGNSTSEITNNNSIEPPSTLDNLKKTVDIGLQLGNNIAASGLEYVEDGVENLVESVGIDPNASVEQEVKKFADKSEEVVQALQSKEGQKALSNLGTAVSEFSDKVISPGVTEIADTVVEHSGPIMNKVVNAGMDAFSATPAGFLLDVPKFFGDVASIAEKSTSMASDVLKITDDTIDKGKQNKGKLEEALSDVQSVINEGNKYVSSGLNTIEKSVDNYGKDIVKTSMQKVPEISNVPEIPNVPEISKYSAKFDKAGGSLKKYKKEGLMIGGRINQSQSEFLLPRVNSSQILKQYGGKWKTKRRHYLKHKMSSRSYK